MGCKPVNVKTGYIVKRMVNYDNGATIVDYAMTDGLMLVSNRKFAKVYPNKMDAQKAISKTQNAQNERWEIESIAV